MRGLYRRLEEINYIGEEENIFTVFLALKLQKPLLIEGAPGVGKTEMGKALAEVFAAELIRLQCYEGLDENKALYEWNYQKQLLAIQMSKELGVQDLDTADLFTMDYLLQRPLLKAIRSKEKAVLLIDEVDKCDHEFEAFLFEVLSDFQVSIPELGTIKARQIPIVVLTSNSERELSDGLRRRCIYLYLDFPSVEREVKIINRKVPEARGRLAEEIARTISVLRENGHIQKKPSIAETLDWARALVSLGHDRLDATLIRDSLGVLLKSKRDQQIFREEVDAEMLWRKVGERP
ncbi:MAG: MoxR family ATPase [Firmicutes bacterium]|nr:MoxR family ATPase [Bacillota bacterium]